MALAERVNVTRRFQRAVRIDLDLDDPGALEGFICPPSSAAVPEDHGASRRREWPRGIHLDRTLWQRQVKPGSSAQRALEW